MYRSSPSEVFLGKGVLKIYSKFTGEHPCRSVISIKLLCNFIEITLRHGCSPVNLLHIPRPPFLKNTTGWLLLNVNSTLKILNSKLKNLKWFFIPEFRFYISFWILTLGFQIWFWFFNSLRVHSTPDRIMTLIQCKQQ